MDHGRATHFFSWQEPLELSAASDEEDVHSSGPDSADSGDEADFIEGVDAVYDIVDDGEEAMEVGTSSTPSTLEGDDLVHDIVASEEEEDVSWSPSTPAGGRGRRRSQPPANTGCRRGGRSRSPDRGCSRRSAGSRSETLADVVAGWNAENVPDNLPHPLPHFLPKRRPGVQPPLSHCVDKPSPFELFQMYFDRAAIKVLCVNTNKNAEKNITKGKKFKWTDITEAEMYQYIGLTLYMGILKLPKLRDFWRVNSIFQVPHPQKVMSRDRFHAITWNLHISDPADDAINDSRKGTADYDCLHRLRPLYDTLRVACKAVYHPQQNISVDERMVATKARIALKKTPTKWGIKLFALSDNTGYTVDFNIYTGRSTLASGKGLSFDAVMALVKKKILGSGYHLYCDNFYTSPALFRHLHDLGFGACGTFRDTTTGVPKTMVNALTKRSPRGTMRWIREGALLFVKWMDTREVNVCSTLHTAFSGDTVSRMSKVDGKHTAVEVPVPSAVKDYNRFMSDQLVGSYSSLRKTRKWYLTVLHHFIDIAVTNSYLLNMELCRRLQHQPMTHQAFIEQLTAELCGVPSQPVQQSYQHIPVAIVEGTSGSKKATKGRRKCKICGRKTPFMCEACKMPLCVIVDRNCHKSYHSSTCATEQ